MSSRDTEARGVKEGKLRFLLYPLAGRVEQGLHPPLHSFLISFSFNPALISFDTSGPAQASTSSRNDNVKDHLKRAQKQNYISAEPHHT